MDSSEDESPPYTGTRMFTLPREHGDHPHAPWRASRDKRFGLRCPRQGATRVSWSNHRDVELYKSSLEPVTPECTGIHYTSFEEEQRPEIIERVLPCHMLFSGLVLFCGLVCVCVFGVWGLVFVVWCLWCGVCGLVFVVVCLLFVVCCLWFCVSGLVCVFFGVCGLVFGAWCLWFGACGVVFVAWCLWCGVWCLWFAV